MAAGLAGLFVLWLAYTIGERAGERRGEAAGRRRRWVELDRRDAARWSAWLYEHRVDS
jgi:hypothetical protein